MLDNSVNGRKPSVKRFRGVWSAFFGFFTRYSPARRSVVTVAGTAAGSDGAAGYDVGYCWVGRILPVTPSCFARCNSALLASG